MSAGTPGVARWCCTTGGTSGGGSTVAMCRGPRPTAAAYSALFSALLQLEGEAVHPVRYSLAVHPLHKPRKPAIQFQYAGGGTQAAYCTLSRSTACSWRRGMLMPFVRTDVR